MITPSFGLTATERVLPRLALDFTTAALDARVTFTRTTSASNPATYIDSNGYITAATSDQPRFDHDPITLACKGLLIEESRTNLLAYSEAVDSWTLSNSTVSADDETSPANTNTADKLITNNGAINGQAYLVVSKAASAITYTYSVFAKAGEWDRVGLYLSDSTSFSNRADFIVSLVDGSAVTAAAARGTFTNGSGTVTNFGNGWFRITLTFTSNTTTSILYRVYSLDSTASTGDGTSGIYIWGAQLETGAFATSYIPTTTAALTRNADVATMTGTNFSDWFNASEGTFEAQASAPQYAATSTFPSPLFAWDNGVNANRIWLATDSVADGNDLYLGVRSGGSNVAAVDAGKFAPNTVFKLAGSYKTDSFLACKDAGTVFSDTAGNAPTGIDKFAIGVSYTLASGFWNGHIQKINYWPQQLTSAEHQAITK